MGKLERVTITMPEEMAAKLRAAVDAGEYATTSEIVREALRDWSDEQDRKRAALGLLRDQIEKARQGAFVDGPEFMEALRDRIAAKVERRG